MTDAEVKAFYDQYPFAFVLMMGDTLDAALKTLQARRDGLLAEIKELYRDKAERLIIGTGQDGMVRLSDEDPTFKVHFNDETGQTITAEVRIADVIDPDDIGIYRELAGGLPPMTRGRTIGQTLELYLVQLQAGGGVCEARQHPPSTSHKRPAKRSGARPIRRTSR